MIERIRIYVVAMVVTYAVVTITAIFLPLRAMAEEVTANVDIDVNALIQSLGSIHPSIPLIIGAFIIGVKVVDTFIKETVKANWWAPGRKIWDFICANFGESRNIGSVDAPIDKDPT